MQTSRPHAWERGITMGQGKSGPDDKRPGRDGNSPEPIVARILERTAAGARQVLNVINKLKSLKFERGASYNRKAEHLSHHDETTVCAIKFPERDELRGMDILIGHGPVQAFPGCHLSLHAETA